MGAFRLGRLRVKNYRSFVDEEVAFKPGGMTLVRGFNHDTGGSSYAGKSSLPVAVALALGYCPFSIKEQQTWGTKSGLSVSQELIIDDRVWTVTRGARTTLEEPDFEGVPGKTITGAAAVDAKLRELTGVTPEILSALTYRRQRQPGMFLKKTDGEKKEFLTVVLGLQAFEAAAEESAKKATALESVRDTIRGRHQQLETQFKSIDVTEPVYVDTAADAAIVQSLEQDLTAGAGTIADFEKRIEATKSTLSLTEAMCRSRHESDIICQEAVVTHLRDELKAIVVAADTSAHDKLRTDLEEARRRLVKLTEAEAQARLDFAARCRALDTEIATSRAQARDFDRHDRDAKDLEAKIAKAKAQRCPTCGQAWNQVETQIQHWDKLRAEAVTAMTFAFIAQAKLPDLERDRAALVFAADPKIDTFRAIVERLTRELSAEATKLDGAEQLARAGKREEIARQEAKLVELKAVLVEALAANRRDFDAALGKDQEDLRGLQASQSIHQGKLYEARLRLKATEGENRTRQHLWQRRKDEAGQVGADLAAAGVRVADAETELNAEHDFEEMIGYRGFLGVIFDEILAEITEETNAILASVANTAHVTVHFASEAVSQKGVARKEIRPVVTIGGYQASLESGASGGMGSSIELAVDLAVAAVVSKRTNSWPGWLILDESFEGMDPVTKETCMEMLSKHAGDRLILVIDHASETKELFSDFIDVHFTNGRSTVKAATK